jgi:hypothetical protein
MPENEFPFINQPLASVNKKTRQKKQAYDNIHFSQSPRFIVYPDQTLQVSVWSKSRLRAEPSQTGFIGTVLRRTVPCAFESTSKPLALRESLLGIYYFNLFRLRKPRPPPHSGIFDGRGFFTGK